MNGKICLKGIRLRAFHGVSEQERSVGNDFEVTLEVRIDMKKAAMTDSLEETVSYADLYAIIVEEMMQPSDLLEHATWRMLTRIADNYPQILGARLELTKLHPPFGGQTNGASVTLGIGSLAL